MYEKAGKQTEQPQGPVIQTYAKKFNVTWIKN
jgi:hypothetical protein